MNLSPFDQTKRFREDGHNSLTPEAEAIRLSNELRAQPARFYLNAKTGQRVDVPAKQGFDCETCDFITMVNWLADTRIKKSESLIAFVHRIMAVRFPDEYAQNRDKINDRYRLEYEMIQSNTKNDIYWLGEVGFQNKIRLDNSITKTNSNTIRQGNDEFKVVRR